MLFNALFYKDKYFTNEVKQLTKLASFAKTYRSFHLRNYITTD